MTSGLALRMTRVLGMRRALRMTMVPGMTRGDGQGWVISCRIIDGNLLALSPLSRKPYVGRVRLVTAGKENQY